MGSKMKNIHKKQLTVRVAPEIDDKLRDILYWNPGMTLNSFIEMTLKEVVSQFQDVQKRPATNVESSAD